MTTQRTRTPEEAYAEDCRRCPTYEDGTPRKSWAQLDELSKSSWRANPTPREFNHLKTKDSK